MITYLFIIFIRTIIKDLNKVKIIENYASKCNLYCIS